MTGADLADWLAFEQINGPILLGDRIDGAIARLSHLLALIHLREPPPAEDFLPRWGEEAPRQSTEAMLELLRGMAAKSAKKREKRQKRKDG